MDADDFELFDRSLRHAAETTSGADLDAALAELGWVEALAAEPRAAIGGFFSHQGAVTTSSSALQQVLVDALGIDAAPAAFVLPAFGGHDPAGHVDGDAVAVHGVAGPGIEGVDAALVVAAGVDGDVRATVVPTADLDLRPVQGIDPWLGLVAVGGRASVTAEQALSGDRWTTAVALGQLAVAHELVGASRTMLDQARTHALERVQFGVTISSFQAVRHRLAETLVAVETAEALLDAAWIDGDPTTAAMAKATAGRSARTASRHCQQVLAGIGFTTEHPLQRSIRRVRVLDELLGSCRSLTAELGAQLLDDRRLPALLPL